MTFLQKLKFLPLRQTLCTAEFKSRNYAVQTTSAHEHKRPSGQKAVEGVRNSRVRKALPRIDCALHTSEITPVSFFWFLNVRCEISLYSNPGPGLLSLNKKFLAKFRVVAPSLASSSSPSPCLVQYHESLAAPLIRILEDVANDKSAFERRREAPTGVCDAELRRFCRKIVLSQHHRRGGRILRRSALHTRRQGVRTVRP